MCIWNIDINIQDNQNLMYVLVNIEILTNMLQTWIAKYTLRKICWGKSKCRPKHLYVCFSMEHLLINQLLITTKCLHHTKILTPKTIRIISIFYLDKNAMGINSFSLKKNIPGKSKCRAQHLIRLLFYGTPACQLWEKLWAAHQNAFL